MDRETLYFLLYVVVGIGGLGIAFYFGKIQGFNEALVNARNDMYLMDGTEGMIQRNYAPELIQLMRGVILPALSLGLAITPKESNIKATIASVMEIFDTVTDGKPNEPVAINKAVATEDAPTS